MTTQSNFFSIVEKDPNQLQGTVSPTGDGKFQAMIAGGWWMAIGATRESAIKKVTNNYHREIEKLGRGVFPPQSVIDKLEGAG